MPRRGKRRRGNLDLSALKPEFSDAEVFACWVKVLDRVQAGEMPLKKKASPPEADKAALVKWLHGSLLAADQLSA